MGEWGEEEGEGGMSRSESGGGKDCGRQRSHYSPWV